ncbi:DNA replication terminus site-binding protein [Marinobacter sp. F3R08]|uniref:DNA replication terminus site-binding protein n=1 Tax=Marinobacter sp. F3R08 TaxID=2841559 RepID=UPI001C092B3C|nr:DNA replication terminus site-binding protein [Marinobacter sp. F3R08]MBU2952314.1 DNA replication terminus site-binding protein [Marinobacter sp. F3R08]
MSQYNAAQLAAINDINERIEALEGVCADLKSDLRQCDISQAKVSCLPRPKKGQETELPERIEPELFTGTEAFDRLLFALTDWYGDGEHSTKFVARTPGAIVAQCENELAAMIQRRVAQANTLKDQIKERIPKLGTRNDRFELLHAHHPMLVTLQLVRQFTVLPPEPVLQSLSFTWGVKTQILKVSVDEAVERIKQRLTESPPDTMDKAQWEWNVAKEMNRVKSLPAHTELRQRRELLVRPMVNIRRHLSPAERDARRQKWQKEKKFDQPVTLREAHTPLILLNPTIPVKIGTLGVYDANAASKRAKRAGRKTSEEPISPLVPIYPVISGTGPGK